MDSTMYFLAGSEVCLKVMPAFAVMSSSCGIVRPGTFKDLAPGGGGGGVGWPSCPLNKVAAMKIKKNALRNTDIDDCSIVFPLTGGYRLCMDCVPACSRCLAFSSL